MRERKRRQGDRGQLAGGDSGAAIKLASWLPGYGLEKLSDAEAARLIGLMDYLNDAATAEGFAYGLRVIWDYNAECDARLVADGPLMNH